MEHYDLVLTSGGPSSYAAALQAIDFGKKYYSSRKIDSEAPAYIKAYFPPYYFGNSH